ncbi:GNAT family N-acetyltransferase, partial [Actinacidiphila rubida]
LCRETLDWAAREGYRGMQFNAVVESNAPAVALYSSLGFRILGTVPDGFRHPHLGYVGLHIMFRPL